MEKNTRVKRKEIGFEKEVSEESEFDFFCILKYFGQTLNSLAYILLIVGESIQSH